MKETKQGVVTKGYVGGDGKGDGADGDVMGQRVCVREREGERMCVRVRVRVREYVWMFS